MRQDVVPGLGTRLQELQGQRGWGQNELARRAGVSNAQMSYLIRGRTDVTFATAVRLARRLGISLDWLAGIDGTCPACRGEVPEGFTCNACGRTS